MFLMARDVNYPIILSFYNTIRRDSGNLLVQRFMSVERRVGEVRDLST